MRRWAKRVFGLVVLALLGAGAFVGYVSWKSADSLVHPARQVTTFTPADAGLAFTRVGFTTDDGLDLVGWWMPDASPDEHGTVVFLHGYGESKNQSLKAAPFLVANGYDVLAFDFRAHGESEGDETTVGLVETRDVRAAIGWLKARGDVDMTRLALMGYSMGAATAINAASEMPEVRAVVSDSSFATLTNIASNSITHFTGLPKYPYGPLSVLFAGWMVGHSVADNQPVAIIGTLDAPVLVIQGADDTIARPDDDGRSLFGAAPPGSELWLVPDSSHVRAVEVAPAEYEARVLAFLDAHLV